jgi:hypothetical protein
MLGRESLAFSAAERRAALMFLSKLSAPTRE